MEKVIYEKHHCKMLIWTANACKNICIYDMYRPCIDRVLTISEASLNHTVTGDSEISTGHKTVA